MAVGACDDGRVTQSATTGAAETTTAVACDAGIARSVVERFLAAHNAGEAGLTDRFFVGDDRFQWYSDEPWRATNAITGPTANPYDRTTLDRFLTERQRSGDRMTLASLTDFTVRVGDGTASFALTVLRPSGVSVGKAALDCRERLLVLVSLGRPSG